MSRGAAWLGTTRWVVPAGALLTGFGSMQEGNPSELRDAPASILSVEDVWTAISRLRDQRLADESGAKQTKKDLAPLLGRVRDVDDHRATRLVQLLSTRNPDPDAADELVLGAPGAQDRELAALRTPAAVDVVPGDATARAAERLLIADEALTALAGSDAVRARRLADLLDRALACVHHDGAQPCPLCGSGRLLDEEWAEATTAERDRLREEAATVDLAVEALRRGVADARDLIRPVPAVLREGLNSVAVVPLREAWTRLRTSLPESERVFTTPSGRCGSQPRMAARRQQAPRHHGRTGAPFIGRRTGLGRIRAVGGTSDRRCPLRRGQGRRRPRDATSHCRDAKVGRVRLPAASEVLLPTDKAYLEVHRTGNHVRARWDPRLGPGKSLGHALRRTGAAGRRRHR